MHPENNFDTHAGTVTVENTGLSGVVVRLSGVSDASATTDASGRYSFTGLRMGNYSVEISGFDSDAVGFSSTASSTSVGVGESKIVSFDGTYLRTAGVSGQVSVEGEGLNGVMVSLRGGPDNVDESTTTDAAGQYAFSGLRAGDYQIGISGYDDTDFEFEVTSKSVTVALGETGYVEFEGELLRTSGLAGRVSVGGMGMAGITVTLSGTADATGTTDSEGIYAFAGLAAGDYTVAISGWNAVQYKFDNASQNVTLEMDKTTLVNFVGESLRTASIKVMVTADGDGLAGVMAQLIHVTGANSGTVIEGGATGADGGITFGPLLAGAYRVDISGFDNEIEFASTSWQGQVATGGTAEATFTGTINREGGIAGSVSVDGEGMGGVMVTLGGDGESTMETGDDGRYSFTGLRRGEYTVSIAPDTDMYSFPSTSRAVSVAIGQMHDDVSFAGTMIRRGSISGQVSVEGVGLEGVVVMLSGSGGHEASDTTDNAGQYVFNGLGGGAYTVSFANPDGNAYDFEAMSADVTIGNAESKTQNFTGTHTRTASVSGMLFVDEMDSNDMLDEGEEPLKHAGIKLSLVGPTVGMQRSAETDAEGMFMIEGLSKGTYQLVVSSGGDAMPEDYGYGGPATGYDLTVEAGMATTQDIPFDITHQTIDFTVNLRTGEETGDALPGAAVTFYADQGGKVQVANGETDEMGMASIRFERPDGDMVYAAVTAPGSDYEVSGDMQMVEWDAQSPMSEASSSQDIVNLKAEVSFNGATITTEAGGGYPLDRWDIDVMMMGEDGMEIVEDAATEFDRAGMAEFMSEADSAADLPMTYYFTIDHDSLQSNSTVTGDAGQEYEVIPMPSDNATEDDGMLVYKHDGLSLPGKMDLGTLEVKYTTQRLLVYVHQERDQVPGFTRTIAGGDARPYARIVTTTGHPDRGTDPGINLELRHIDENGRSRPVPEYENRNRHPSSSVLYNKVPSHLNIVVKASIDSDRRIINNDEAQAYRDFDTNKIIAYHNRQIIGTAFGEHGGIHHSVYLCPESADDPDQDYEIDNACSTFAYVWTRDISGNAMRTDITMELDGNDFEPETTYHADISVSLVPVDRKNVQMDNFGATTRDENDNTADRELGTYSIARVGDGDYRLRVTSGWWDITNGYKSYTHTENPTRDRGAAPPDDVVINVVPQSVDVYGTIKADGPDGTELEGVKVTRGGVTVTTDEFGRYLLDDNSLGRSVRMWVSKPGYEVKGRSAHAIENGYTRSDTHWSNTPLRKDFVLEAVAPTGTVTGTIAHFQTGDPIEGVRVFALEDGEGPVRADLSEIGLTNDAILPNGVLKMAAVDTTDAEGMYTLEAPAGTLNGNNTTIFAYKSGMFFIPDRINPAITAGGEYSYDFKGLGLGIVTGRVVEEDGNRKTGIEGVSITVTGTGGANSSVSRTGVMTNSSGRFTVRVPWGPYEVTATKASYSFHPSPQYVAANAEETTAAQEIVGSTSMVNSVRGERTAGSDGVYDGNVKITWKTKVTENRQFVAQYDNSGTWTTVGNPLLGSAISNGTGEVMSTDGSVPDAEFKIRVVSLAADADDTDAGVVSAGLITGGTVSALTPSVSDLKAPRNGDALAVTWNAKTNGSSELRILVEAEVNGARQWFVASTPASSDREATISLTNVSGWQTVDGRAATPPSDEELAKALKVKIQARQGSTANWADADGPVDVPAKT